jgi:hypothetical protein
MIRLRLHLERINRDRIFVDKEGRRCLSFLLLDPGDPGLQAGKVVMSLSKEQRANGQKGEICGTWEAINTNGGGSKLKPKPTAKSGRS